MPKDTQENTLPIAGEGKVKVKALEWSEDSYGNWFADSPFGSEFIQKWKFSGIDKTVFEYEGTNYDTVAAAKAAAQADFETRILSALISSPGKEVEVVALYQVELEDGTIDHISGVFGMPVQINGMPVSKVTPLYARPQPASKAQEVEAVKYEARICKGVPADCCDYGVVDLEEGIEVCRVWKEADARLIADLLNGTVWPEPTEDGDDLTECFRHHVRTAIGWQAFGARPGPEMQMYEEGFKAGYRRCQSDNETEFGEEEDELDARARKVIGRLRDSLKAGGVEQIDIDNAVDLIIDQAKALAIPQPASTALVEAEHADVPQSPCPASDWALEHIERLSNTLSGLRDYFLRNGWDEKSIMVDSIAAALSASQSTTKEQET